MKQSSNAVQLFAVAWHTPASQLGLTAFDLGFKSLFPAYYGAFYSQLIFLLHSHLTTISVTQLKCQAHICWSTIYTLHHYY